MLNWNQSHLEHAIIAVGIQLLLWPIFGVVAAGVIACTLFLGREIMQHEYKEMQILGLTTINELRPNIFVGVYKHWTEDSVMDVVACVLSCSLTALVAFLFFL